jgi:hypothetical protein
MTKRNITLVLIFIILLGGTWFVVRRDSNVATYDDYQECVRAGGSTIEPNPPTCFHPNGMNITPGHKIIRR